MLLEMHCHTAEHSQCSSINAAELTRQVFAKRLQGIVFTDHHYLWPLAEIQVVRRQAGVPDYFVMFSGQEVTTGDAGDVLVYGADVSIERGTPLMKIRSHYPEAALVLAHPFRDGRRPEVERLLDPVLDCVEIFSSNHSVAENSRGLQAWHTHKFTAIAGTDTHGGSYAGIYPTLFDHPVRTMADLVMELRKGRCHPFFKEITRAGTNIHVDEITIGTKGADEIRERIIIKNLHSKEQWQVAERADEILRVISEHGFDSGRYRVPVPIDRDEENMTVLEQGIRGKTLFERIIATNFETGRYYIQLAAQWLARLHGLRLQITPPGEFLDSEQKHFSGYLSRVTDIKHPHTRRVKEIITAIQDAEGSIILEHPDSLIQGHGDYHPKNVYIGQDLLDKPETLYVAVIDFGSSRCLPPAFDVGAFVAQFRNQFFAYPEILKEIGEDVFINAYRAAAPWAGHDFLRYVELFHARCNLSIAAFLVKLGLGDSENLWRVLVEAERAIANFRA